MIAARRDCGDVPAFSRILVETTGLADPAPIVQLLLNNPLVSHFVRLDAVVTTVDAANGLRHIDEHAEAIKQAALADKFTVLRSMHLTAGGHPAGSMQLLSGDSDTRDKPKPRLPDWMSVTNYLRSQEGPRDNPLPLYAGINPPLEYNGPAYLGDAYSPFVVTGDPNQPTFSVPNIGLTDQGEVKRLGRRSDLRRNLDTLERAFDQRRELAALIRELP